MWYNSLNDAYIFTSTQNTWHIAESENYEAVNGYSYAYSDSINAKCPQDLDYKLYLIDKWTDGTDVSVASGKHDFWLLKSAISLIRVVYEHISVCTESD